MKILKSKFAVAALIAALPGLSALAQSSEDAGARVDLGNLRTFVEMARADVKAQKALVMAQNLPLTEAEGAEFWPLQREYETELSKLNDRKLELIRRYAANYMTMSDKEAAGLAAESFKLEEKKTDLKRKYFKKFKKVIPAVKAARFFQIENQLNMVLDLQVAASLPLIK